jgi:putative peptidoglycan lipid II flippase
MDDGLALAMAFTLPAAVALFVMPFFLIDATVTRGAFTSTDAIRTADVLRQFAWGVPAFVLAKVFTPPYFARHDMKAPMKFAMVSVAVNVVLGAGLFYGLGRVGGDGVVGLAVATSVSAWVNVMLLGGTLARRGDYRLGARVWSRLARIGLASAAMGAVLLLFSANYERLRDVLLTKEIAILAACLVGFGVYGAAVLLFRAVTPAELKSVLRREPGGGGAAAAGFD